MEIGAGDRIRTGDINLGKVALYQLSYSRPLEDFFILARGPSICQFVQEDATRLEHFTPEMREIFTARNSPEITDY